jgi:hypothetical protein
MTSKYKYCALASLAVTLLAMLPQIHLWLIRGREWNGHYVVSQGDEPLYSAYVNALMDGRPRKNDPFGGRDDVPPAPLPESTFSIQFMPAYAIAFTASMLRISASTAFIIHTAITAVLASAAIFSLLALATHNYGSALAGTLFVLCCGGAVGTFGLFGTFIDGSVGSLAFLRRYEPAAPFPIFFLFQFLVWHAIRSERKRFAWFVAVLAAVTLSVLVFSYMYLWTAAAAWLICFAALWFVLRKPDRRNALLVLIVIMLVSGVALLLYAHLLSQRAPVLDEQHTLISTHKPDLFRASEIIGALTLLGLIIGRLRRRVEWEKPQTIAAASLALLPLWLFNQQVLTGKTMQVFHYEVFVVNYSTLIALWMAISILAKKLSRRLLISVAVASFLWGLVSVGLTSRLVAVPRAFAADKKLPVLFRLRELSRLDGTLTNLNTTGKSSTLVYSSDLAVSVLLPTWTAQGSLLDIGGIECGTISRQQRKELFYEHLYYSMTDPAVLREGLEGESRYATMESYARIVVFGSERVSPVLSNNFRPIQSDEIEREVQTYVAFLQSFSKEEAQAHTIAYAVIPADGAFDFTNLDHWYERDAGERWGDYVLYRLKPRP